MARNGSGQSGFTIVELLTTIAIMGILASVVVPTLGRTMNKWRVDRFTRSLVTANRTARFKAITYQTEIQARYDIDNNLLEFWQNTNKGYSDDADNWVKFDEISTLRAEDPVVIYSVADQTSGAACMVYKRNGTATTHYDRAQASGEGCTSDAGELGSGVHVTWDGVDDSTIDGDNACNWDTVHVVTANGKPMFLSYGAYPNDGGSFDSWDAGQNVPTCAN